jgi:hypothetical protein
MSEEPSAAPSPSDDDDRLVLFGRRKWAGLWTLLAAFGALSGAGMLATGGWFGWVLIVVFLPSAIILTRSLRPSANRLEIDHEGFTVATSQRETTFRWTDVERLGAVDTPQERRVAYRLSPAAAASIPNASEIAAAMDGYHRTLPMTYGFPADELVALMDRYRVGGAT